MRRSPFAAALGLALAACVSVGPPAGQSAPSQRPSYDGPLRVEPDPVEFEDTFVGCVRSVTLRIDNTHAEAPVTLQGGESPTPALSLSGEFPMTLKPGGRGFADLHFAPAEPLRWAGVVRLLSDGAPYPLLARIQGLAAPPRPTDMSEVQPLDLVFVLDVSTTMDEMASLRKAIEQVFDFVEKNRLDARFGLVTFENEVVVHRRGAFLERAAFFQELDSQLVAGTWVPDPSLPRQLLNYDFEENILNALHRSATDFDFRPEARRYFLLMTDATFLEPPRVFSDGTPAVYSYDEVRATLDENQVRLFSVHASDEGRGLSSHYLGQPSLVSATRGTWFELADVSSGALTLDSLLSDLVVGPICE